MKNNRILYVLNSNGVGGAEVSIKRMTTQHFKVASVVTLWDHPNAQVNFWNDLGPRYTHLLNKKLNLFTLLLAVFHLRKFIKRNDFSVIQTQLKGADVILGFLKMFHLINSNIILVASLRNSYGYYYKGSLANKIFGLIHQFLLKNYFDKVVVISLQDLDEFKSAFGLKLRVIENSIQKNSLAKDTNFPYNLKKLSIIMVGNIKFRKGYDKLLKFCDLLEVKGIKYEINIAGGVEDEDLLVEVLSKNNDLVNGKINYLGKVDDVFQELKSADLFLSLSRDEGLPISVLEGMSVRLPMVLSGIQAHRLIIPDISQHRVLFSTIENAVELVFRKFQDQEALNVELDAQQNLLNSRFDFETMCDKYDDVYQSEMTS
ncbi:glycosyltransferase family 4 protein [Algoriphagus hitonicola]|uniref:Glycosyltransferase involved in cell wall bisynthesis n=1 Tax=Algoriphagus hitonicola TaxID=435880 RepID=A0A1I2X615_9BACT|nr:glycosyltransferase family 4 protein [Algoriphagus hitonicola]SFH08409.1 Glycosyltransferase involved in cell wall bisynthesis [Algoriphagus hitonicola]